MLTEQIFQFLLLRFSLIRPNYKLLIVVCVARAYFVTENGLMDHEPCTSVKAR